MAIKNGIGYSPLTDKVYLGKQNTDKRMWIGSKVDITDNFLSVLNEYFPENTLRKIDCGENSNLFINIKLDKESIEKLIKKMQKKADKLK